MTSANLGFTTRGLSLGRPRMTRAEELGQLLRRLRTSAGLNRPELVTELAKLSVEVSAGYLAKLESGTRSFEHASLQLREGLRQVFRIAPDDWARQTGLHVPLRTPRNEARPAHDTYVGKRRIGVIDLLSAGPGSDGGTVIEEIEIPDSMKGEHAAYAVSGDSMAPDIPDNSIVVVRCQSYASPGNEIVCWTPDYGMLVKNLDRITAAGELVLTSNNPEYRPIWATELKIYGVVVEVRIRRKPRNGNHGPN